MASSPSIYNRQLSGRRRQTFAIKYFPSELISCHLQNVDPGALFAQVCFGGTALSGTLRGTLTITASRPLIKAL